MALLEIRNMVAEYGRLEALKGISLTVEKGEIVALLGSNGAGKSTTLKTISGLLKPKSGMIMFADQEISGMPPHDIVSLGVVHVPEGRQVFSSLTVDENLDLGAFTIRDKTRVEESRERVFSYFPRLKDRRAQLAGTLSGGEQQMLAMGRALMGEPKLLMLDEPSMGLAPLIVASIMELISEINRVSGISILLVEQNARAALKQANRGYVIETGEIVLSGSTEELSTNEKVIKAYLGM